MVRVLHFSQTLPGGPASYLEEIVTDQIRHFGVENVRFLLPKPQRSYVPTIPDEAIVYFDSTSRHPLALAKLTVVAARAIREFQPDILHLHSTFAGAVGRIPLLFKRSRPAVVYCAHGWAFTMQVPLVEKKIYASFERLCSLTTDRIINISRHEEKVARAHGLPAEKLVTVLNGIGQEFDRANDHVPFDQSKINLLFVGRHDPQKGLDIILDAMDQIGDCPVHLHVLGDSVVSQRHVEIHASKNVSFHGWMPRGRVFDFIAESDAVVMPSRWEGFGLVAVEAMRMARPVIASNRGALPEIVTNGRTGFVVDIDRPGSFVDLFRSLDRQKLQAMGRDALEDYRLKFTAERMNGQLIKIYENVLAERSDHGRSRH